MFGLEACLAIRHFVWSIILHLSLENMKLRLIKRFFIPFLFFVILGGCAKNKVHTTTKENPTDESTNSNLKKVNFQGDLKDKLTITKLTQGMVSDDLLKVQVRLQNSSDKDLNLTYKFEWLEENGMMIKDSSLVWIPLLVRGGESLGIQSVATTTKAKNFYLKIQRAKNP